MRNGGSYFSAPVSRMIVEGYLETSKAATVEKLSVLTPREREVLQLIAEGNSYKEIAVGPEDQPEDRRPASGSPDAETPLPAHSRAREVCFAGRRNAGLRVTSWLLLDEIFTPAKIRERVRSTQVYDSRENFLRA